MLLRRIWIIITRDTDSGEVLRYPNHPGVIILESVSAQEMTNSIVTVELEKYRKRPIEG